VRASLVVAPRGQFLAPLHDGRAEFQLHRQQVVEADLGDALDLAQALGDFIGALVFQAAREGGDDGLARQALSGRAL
jgi:hypothetical protein